MAQRANLAPASDVDTNVVSFSDGEEEEELVEDNADDERGQEEDDDDDDDEAEETSFWEDVRASWRQHCVACLVAVLATALAYFYQQQQLIVATTLIQSANTGIIAPKQAGRRSLLHQQPTLAEDTNRIRNGLYPSSLSHHPLLHSYHRTANISFCGKARQMTTVPFKIQEQQLAVMDFDVPDSLISVLTLHFNASSSTSAVLNKGNGGSSNSNKDIMSSHYAQLQSEIQCIQRLRQHSPQNFIKGVTMYYKRPTIESMYRDDMASSATSPSTTLSKKVATTSTASSSQKQQQQQQAAVLTFTGFAAKFVNMGVEPVLLYWDGRGGDAKNRRLIGEIAPFEALSTATRPGQSFSVSPVYDHLHALDRWVVTEDDAVQYYEPDRPTRSRTDSEQVLYDRQKLNQEFAQHYLIHSRRTWLSHFPRAFLVHHMWPADHFGESHTVTVATGDEEETSKRKTYTLQVASVTPRVFTIRNFLSPAECDALLELAQAQGSFVASTLFAGGSSDATGTAAQTDSSIRSSSNTWLTRDSAALTDEIYRRAAHVTKIDESLLQAPLDWHDEQVDWPAHHHPMAESLQVIRYQVGEEYAPHHDWTIPSQQHPYQPTRFATLLLYLNDDYQGGRTTFPRAVNAHYHEGVTIQPEKGTAVLFYNVLPDGNVDDLSIHGSEKVTSGVKYAANLWLWEPTIN